MFGAGAVIIALGVYNYFTGGRVSTPAGIGLLSILTGFYLNRPAKARNENRR